MNKVEKTLLSFQSVMINPEWTFSLPARCEPYLHPALYSSTPYSQSVRVIVCVIFLSLKLRLFSISTSTWMFVCENLFTIKEKTVWCEVCIFNAKPAWFEPPQRWHVFNGSCWRQRPPEDHFTSIKLLCFDLTALLIEIGFICTHCCLLCVFSVLKNTEFNFLFHHLYDSYLCSLVAAQRKGPNEISSTTECPNSAGLPQTETGKLTCGHTQHLSLSPFWMINIFIIGLITLL